MRKSGWNRESFGFLALLIFTGFLGGCGQDETRKRWTRLSGQSAPETTPFRLSAGGTLGKRAESSAASSNARMGAGPGAPSSSREPAETGTPPLANRQNVLATTGSLVAAGIGFMIPEGWQPEEPSSPMRLAQYRLPGSGGDAEMTVFAFGPGQGGAPKANIERWVAQFHSDEATTSSQPADVAELETGGLRLYLVRTSGTYTPTAMGMMGPPQAPKRDYALFGLVVEGGPQGLVFVKVTGPRATMVEQNENLETFTKSATRM